MTFAFVDNFAFESGFQCEPTIIDIDVSKMYVVVQIVLNKDKLKTSNIF